MCSRLRFAAILLAALSACGLVHADDDTLLYGAAAAPKKAAGSIRLATYNVLNLFDREDDPALEDRWELEPKPDGELEAVAKAIRAVDADVLALQEVESLEALTWFRNTYLEGMGYEHIASVDVGYYRGVENSVLSRFPITGTKIWPNMPLKGEHPKLWNGRENRYYGEPLLFRRSPLRVDVQISEDYALRLYVVHHKSGGGNEYWREAESEGLVSILQQDLAEDAQRNIAVLGDFNAQPWEESVRTYLAADLVDTMDHRAIEAVAVDSPGAADDGEAYGRIVVAPQYATHESRRAIDLILVDSALLREILPGSGFIHATPARPEGHDYRVDPTPKGYASDHYPLAVDLLPRDR